MTKRKLKKLSKRITNLPKGIDLFKYFSNKIHALYLKKSNSLNVAYPSTIMLEVTNHCNLKCITCPREYSYGAKMDKGYMNFEMLKQIVDETYPYVDSIGLTGLGETLLYKELIDAIDYIKNKSNGIIVSCSINAHLNTSVEMVSKLINKIDTIQVSIDGLNEIYEKVRINGNFSFFETNLKKIASLCNNTETDLMLNVVLVKENYKQMSELIQFANDLGIKFINMIPLNLVAKTDEDVSYYNFFFSDEFQNELDRAKATARNFNNLEFTYSELVRNEGFNTCKYPWNYFYVSWDGYLPPCCAKPFPKELSFGNVFEDGLMNSLNSKEFKDFRKLWYRNETPEFCNKCSATL